MRKLATATAVSLILASSGAHALGLGDIEMRSALNQPMNAQIRLTSVQPGEADGMIVKLASPDAFVRAGIERSQALTNLQFSVDYSGPSPVIKITSRAPVVEPFLNFLLEVQWPSGRMVREYTVLLDPPVFMTPNATARNTTGDSPVLLERGEQSIVAPTPIERNTNAAVTEAFDESSVVVVGSTEETLDSASAGTEIELGDALGETVSLDNLDEGEVVSLTDLAAPNTEALETIATSDLQPAAVDYDFPEVELIGGTTEVSNDFTTGEVQESATVDLNAELNDSEVVSLEEISTEEISVQEFSGGGEVTVERGQTLGEIAEANAIAGVSRQQMLMALLKANQGAFINNNVNLVKAGAILRIPDAAEASEMSQAEAVAQMSEQNQLWREYRDNVRSNAATRIATTQASDSSDEPTETAADSAVTSVTENTDTPTTQSGTTDELKIVAGDEPAISSDNATAEEAADSTAAKLGEINRQLQLAREELASTRLQSEDLSEQVANLESTDEDLNTLVQLRQNQVAQLQEQLKQTTAAAAAAKIAEAEASSTAVDELNAAVEEAGAQLSDSADAVTENVAAATDAVTDQVASAADAVGDAGSDAMTAAGQKLDQVDLVNDGASTDASTTVDPVQTAPEPWYQKLFSDYGKFGLMGLLGLCLLGLIALLFKKRRKTDDRLEYQDEVEFIDDDEAASLSAEISDTAGDAADKVKDISGSTAAAATAGVAAVGGAAAGFMGKEESSASDAIADVDDLDADDTISEVDVYLAYGLHGQAEELLTKAVNDNPDNPEYASKLLQTYHAQGNTEAFNSGASDFKQTFGENNEYWSDIVSMGNELEPNNTMFSGAAEQVERVGTGDLNAPKLESHDFITSEDSAVGSIKRDFSANEDNGSDDETDIMDQSLDPGFAFDESDLEATGDFSEAAAEIAEDSGTIEFPDFDKTDAPTISDDSLDGALTLDELDIGDVTAANSGDNATSIADDLTLDLDQLSGDLELDSTSLLDGADSDSLEIPDLTSDNELLSGTDSADEMDTMMDLAKAYIDMGDKDSASSALGEIVKSGTPAQVSEAETLLRKIS